MVMVKNMENAGDRKAKLFYGNIIVAVVFGIMMVVHTASFSFGVFLKPLSSDFGWSRAMTSGAISVCSLAGGFFTLLSGRLCDRYGPRALMTVCAVLFGVGYLLMSQINALWQLYLLYGVMIAMGMSGGFVPLVSTVARWFNRR